ncbi:MFS transporter [Streptomyces sp. ISL-96]|uniref:peptide MFS transporter n=1 Tax=Streptomyces sp. ISL-96 TaxID=2819191 RepID=UPI001BEC3B9E|nr:oligopeptide:H+ symporter [Streptomyces sp. ISL-96]MBT2493481.1 MFS transporter [Streptomyces sp. ISL-96]
MESPSRSHDHSTGALLRLPSKHKQPGAGTSVPPVHDGGATGPGARRAFITLLGVDLWERFSFFGMAAILVLYLTAAPADGGMGMASQTATAVFAAYMSLNFMAGLPGGWLADRVLGARRAVLLGGALIATGHAVLSITSAPALYAGLALIVVGTGLTKPSLAAMVAAVSGAEKREEAFSRFYMCIQVSALLAPVVTGLLAEKVAWHLGFAAAAFGMAAGLAQFSIGLRSFERVGRGPARPVSREEARTAARRAAMVLAVAAVAVTAVALGVLPLTAVLALLGLATLSLPFLYLRMLSRRTPVDGKQLSAFTAVMGASAAFWMIFAQSGSVLSLFAERHTDRVVLAFEVPASWLLSVHPLFVLLLAPFVTRLRGAVTTKVAGALGVAGLSFVVMAGAALMAQDRPVSMGWLIGVYLLYSFGEIILAPAGLALAAAVAPPGFMSRFLALNGMFAAVGVVLGGQLYRLTAVLPLPVYFLLMGTAVLAVGAAVMATARRLRPYLPA